MGEANKGKIYKLESKQFQIMLGKIKAFPDY